MLSRSISLSPPSDTTDDKVTQTALLLHIGQIQEYGMSIRQLMQDKRMARMKPWPIWTDDNISKERCLTYSKFAVVYAHNGCWEEARRLQEAVVNRLVPMLGYEHPAARRVTLARSNTLVNLHDLDRAADLRTAVYNACCTYVGFGHHETLVAQQLLGDIKYHQGYLREALLLHEDVAEGFTKLHGVSHEETLNAMDHFGRTLLASWATSAVSTARKLHQQTVDGMRQLHGAHQLRTLTAIENLCATALQSAEHDQLLDAHEMMLMVVQTRTTELGKEHATTLYATMTLCLIKSELSDHIGAETLIATILPIAERNLGENHPRVLWAQCILGKIVARQERWEEAEKILINATTLQRGHLQKRSVHQLDLLEALAELGAVYNALGKYQDSDLTVDEVLHAYHDHIVNQELCTSSEWHPVAKKLREKRSEWVEQRPKELINEGG
jgi:tetratricopeptide (TPR) repeat protein